MSSWLHSARRPSRLGAAADRRAAALSRMSLPRRKMLPPLRIFKESFSHYIPSIPCASEISCISAKFVILSRDGIEMRSGKKTKRRNTVRTMSTCSQDIPGKVLVKFQKTIWCARKKQVLLKFLRCLQNYLSLILRIKLKNSIIREASKFEIGAVQILA